MPKPASSAYFSRSTERPGRSSRTAIWCAIALLIVEFAAIGAVFKHVTDFDCDKNWPFLVCMSLDRGLIAAYGMLGGVGCFLTLSPRAMDGIGKDGLRGPVPLCFNLAGVALALLPVFLLDIGEGTAGLLPSLAVWGMAIPLILAGCGMWLAPGPEWRRFAREHGFALLVCAVIGAIIPLLGIRLRPVWGFELIKGSTFSAVSFVIESLGYDLTTFVDTRIMGSGDFFVKVGKSCAGFEGVALSTGFVSLYLWLFRDTLRFPRALILYPFGICVSFLLNIFRISVLLIIGFEGYPEFAVGGFHSHAGWLMFTFVALGVVMVSSTFGWIKKPIEGQLEEKRPALPLSQDETAAKLLPFAIFMFSALLANNLSPTPGVLYPLRALMMGAALVLFWPVLQRLDWRLSPQAIGVGCIIGLGWVLIPVAPTEVPAYGALTGSVLVLWFVMRGIGTVVLVPIIEELFFRDYLEHKFQSLGFGTDQRFRKILAACLTAGLFAALHDRWAEAFAAGLLFSYLVQRRGGQISDAIVAHAVANLLVFAVAVAVGNLALI